MIKQILKVLWDVLKTIKLYKYIKRKNSMTTSIEILSIVLTDAGKDKFKVAELVSEILNISLMHQAKDLVFKTPSVIKENISFEEAEEIQNKLEEVGAIVEIRTYKIEKKILYLLKTLTTAMGYADNLEEDEDVFQFLPNKVATNELIEKIEADIGVKIPSDLKHIYLEEGNGIQYDEESFNSDKFFHLYPIENIITLYDFFKTQCSYFDISMKLKYSDEILVEVDKISKTLFVYAVSNSDSEQFVDLFLFDPEGKFYTLNYDHDEIFTYYEVYLKNFYQKMKSYNLFEFLYVYIKNEAEGYLTYVDISIDDIVAKTLILGKKNENNK